MSQISQRRGIHSKNDGEEKENKQGVQKCYKCDKPITTKDKTEQGQLGKEPSTNFSGRGSEDNPDLNEIADILCADCGNTTNQGNGRYCQFIENFAVKYMDNLKLLNSSQLYFLIFAVVATGCILALCYKVMNSEKTLNIIVKNQTQEAIDFDNKLDDLESIYEKQEERVWYTFAGGIKSVLSENPNKPSVFLLMYDNDLAGKTAKCLAQDISKAATKYLMKEEISPLIYAGADLNNNKRIMNDPGELIVLLKNKVARNGAMIVTNLEEVQPKIAAIFHFFCDRFSPVVDKAIYIFTVRLKQGSSLQRVSESTLQRVAESTLQSLWENHLPDNVLLPLITRMTGNVIRISDDHSGCYFNAQNLI